MLKGKLKGGLTGLALGVILLISSCGYSPFSRGILVTPPTQSLGATLNSQAADHQASFSYEGRYLVFSSDRDRQRKIYLYDRQQQRLINLPGLNQPGIFYDEPDLSADGRYIVYVSEESGKRDIYLYDRQTMQPQQITQQLFGDVRHPTISGNGRLIAFESNRSGQWNIEIYDRGPGVDLSLPHPLNNSGEPSSE